MCLEYGALLICYFVLTGCNKHTNRQRDVTKITLWQLILGLIMVPVSLNLDVNIIVRLLKHIPVSIQIGIDI